MRLAWGGMANEALPDGSLRDDEFEFALNGPLNLRRTVLRLLTAVRPVAAELGESPLERDLVAQHFSLVG